MAFRFSSEYHHDKTHDFHNKKYTLNIPDYQLKFQRRAAEIKAVDR